MNILYSTGSTFQILTPKDKEEKTMTEFIERFRLLAGGLAGCLIGIVLAGTFANPWLLLLAFPGAFLGMHFDRIASRAKKIAQVDIKEMWAKIPEQRKYNILNTVIVTALLCIGTINLFASPVRFFIWLIKGLAGLLLGLHRVPKFFYSFSRETFRKISKIELEPEQKAELTRALVCFLGYGSLIIVSSFIILPTPKEIPAEGNLSIEKALASFIVWFFIGFIPAAIHVVKTEDDSSEIFVTEMKKRAGEKSTLGLIVSEALIFPLFCLGMFLGIVVIGPVLALGLSVGAIALIITLIFLAILRGFYWTAFKYGGWTCASITLIFALVSGIWFWDQIVADLVFRWTLAIVSGFAAGTVSLLASETSKIIFKKEKILWMAAPEEDNGDFPVLVFMMFPIWRAVCASIKFVGQSYGMSWRKVYLPAAI